MASNNPEVVRVTEKGQAIIPSRFGALFGIGAPGFVSFRIVSGRLVVEPLPTPAKMKGFMKADFGRESGVALLRRERGDDEARARRKFRL
ncbi:MAG: AbrB/MazE/SpoVT family DNA-binding domain-containing protein [Euryarchaeota archaeon]|nr:AbrB/MazE/SpoVT family DNA-binding domain-containing protein [Euryarchaeota archaeon]